MSEKQNIELLAPAKTADIGIEAINHDADAVYIREQRIGEKNTGTNRIKDKPSI